MTNQDLSKFRYLSREKSIVSTYSIKSDRDHLKFITVESTAIKMWTLESDNQVFLDFTTKTPGTVLKSSLLQLSPQHLALGLVLENNQGALHFLTLTLVSIHIHRFNTY